MSLDKKVVYAIAGVAAVGAGAGLAYYLYKQQKQPSDGLVELELQIEEVHIEWLNGVATKHTSGDSVKALQKMIDYCKKVSADEEGAEKIFKEVRCKTCGSKKKVAYVAKMRQDQLDFIGEAAAKYEITAGQDKALRVMFEYAINDAEETAMFGA